MRPGMFDFRGTVKWEAWLGELQNGDLDMSDTNDCLVLVGGVTQMMFLAVQTLSETALYLPMSVRVSVRLKKQRVTLETCDPCDL